MYLYVCLYLSVCLSVYIASEPVTAKFLAYNRANRTVAVLCNHQRAVPKNFDKQMENLQAKVSSTLSVYYALSLVCYHNCCYHQRFESEACPQEETKNFPFL